MENTYNCPNCNAEIITNEFLPDYLKCFYCNKTWEMDSDSDIDNYYYWITSNEIIEK